MTLHRVEVIRLKVESVILYIDAPPGVLEEDDGFDLSSFPGDCCWNKIEGDNKETTYCEVEELPESIREKIKVKEDLTKPDELYSESPFKIIEISGRNEDGKLKLKSGGVLTQETKNLPL